MDATIQLSLMNPRSGLLYYTIGSSPVAIIWEGLMMYSTSCKDEVVIKLVGKLSLEYPELNQLTVRNIVEEVLYKYDVAPRETALVASDVEEKMQIYLATKRFEGLSERTLKHYEYNLIKFASCLRKPLSTVDTVDLRMFLSVRCQNMKESSKNAQITILKTFFGWLADEGYIPKNPAQKLKNTKQPKRMRNPLSEEELEIIRQSCSTLRQSALIEFMYSTGCRLSEIVDVDKDSVNWHERALRVIGKGNKEREVFFTSKAKILLKKYLNSRTDDCPALFVTERGPYRRMGRRAVEKEVAKIGNRSGIDKPVFPHIFRHSLATHLLDKGVPLHIVQEVLGHETSSTTQIYARTSRENVIHELKKIS